MRPRPTYAVFDVDGEPLVLRDTSATSGSVSVTNAAETVVLDLATAGKIPAGRRLLYVDSTGRMDELLVEDGQFRGFAPVEELVELRARVSSRVGVRTEDLSCPRERSDMTPCVVRDGSCAATEDSTCVGCGCSVASILADERSTWGS